MSVISMSPDGDSEAARCEANDWLVATVRPLAPCPGRVAGCLSVSKPCSHYQSFPRPLWQSETRERLGEFAGGCRCCESASVTPAPAAGAESEGRQGPAVVPPFEGVSTGTRRLPGPSNFKF